MQRDILQGKVSQDQFSNWIHSRQGRVSFLLEPSTLKRRRDSDFKKQFCNYEK